MRSLPAPDNQEGMLDMEYKIVVQATVNREYLVKADSPEDAITKYRQGEGTLTYQANDETDPWPEDWDTAGVMMHCELCGDERLEEDLNSELRCRPCVEREERNEGEDGE